jgi:flagellar biosynthesis/type III secretory pathway protein FliH
MSQEEYKVGFDDGYEAGREAAERTTLEDLVSMIFPFYDIAENIRIAFESESYRNGYEEGFKQGFEDRARELIEEAEQG